MVAAQVQVVRRGGQLAVAEDLLHRQDIDAGFEQVGGEGVPERVHRGRLANVGAAAHPLEQPLHSPRAQRPLLGGIGEQPALGAVAPPVVAQLGEQAERQRHQAILTALALVDMEQQPRAVDGADFQVEHFAQAQAAGIGGLQEHAVAPGPGRGEQQGDLVGAEHAGQLLGPFAVQDVRHLVGAAQRGAVQEAQGADDLIELAPGDLFLEQVQLKGPDLFAAE